MRRRRTFLLVTLIVVVLAATLVVLMWAGSPSREYRMADGSVLRIEKVSYGKRVPFVPPTGLLQRLGQKLAPLLPKVWAASLPLPATNVSGTWYMNGLVHSNNDTLHIWISRRTSVSGAFQDVGIHSGEIVDEHGCIYFSTQSGGENHGSSGPPAMGAGWIGPQSTVTWLTFEGFPRHEKELKLRVFDWKQYGLMAEFTVPNPLWPPKPPAEWQAGPLPVTASFGDVSFVLKSAKLKTNSNTNPARTRPLFNPVELVPEFGVSERGQPTQAWEPVEMELWDASGNFANRNSSNPKSVFLCPQEPAWRLLVKFCGGEQSPTASNTYWTLTGLEVPAPGKVITLESERALQGVRVTVIGMCGVGEVDFDDGKAIRSTLIEESKLTDFANQTRHSSSPAYTVRSRMPYVAINFGRIENDQRLTVRMKDDQGRETFARQWMHAQQGMSRSLPADRPAYLNQEEYMNGKSLLTLDVPAGVQNVDVTICVHNAKTAEFKFKPPAR